MSSQSNVNSLGAAPDPADPAPGVIELAHRALDALERDAKELAHAMAEASRGQVSAIGAAAASDPDLMARSVRISEQSVRTLVTVTRERRDPTDYELAFVHELAIRRAADAFPLDALLHSLRVGQRLIWQHVVNNVTDDPLAQSAIIWLTEQTLRYTDSLSMAMAATYARTQQARAADHQRRRIELLEEIVSGRFPYRPDTPSRVASLGLDPDDEWVVLVAVEVNVRAPSDPLIRERIRDALERHARRSGAHVLAVDRDTDVIAVISPPSKVRAIANSALDDLGPTARQSVAIGLSDICPRLGDAARGNIEALRALAVVRHTGGIAALGEIRLFEYLVAHADSTARRLLPRVARALAESSNGREPLADTLKAYLDSNMSVPKTATRLSVHPNTVRYRLEKIEQLTGLDTRRFWDLAELAVAQRLLAHPALAPTSAPVSDPRSRTRRPSVTPA